MSFLKLGALDSERFLTIKVVLDYTLSTDVKIFTNDAQLIFFYSEAGSTFGYRGP